MIDLCALQVIPYVDGGRSNLGADCYGIGWLYNYHTGRLLPRFATVTAADQNPFLRAVAECRATWREIDRGEQQPGDAVLLRRHLSTLPLHLGWFVHDGRVMSTTRATGVTFTEIEELKKRMSGIYRYECDHQHTVG